MPQGEKWEISIDFFVEFIWLHVCITCAHKMLIKWNFRQSPSVLFFFKELVLFSNDKFFSALYFPFLFRQIVSSNFTDLKVSSNDLFCWRCWSIKKLFDTPLSISHYVLFLSQFLFFFLHVQKSHLQNMNISLSVNIIET